MHKHILPAIAVPIFCVAALTGMSGWAQEAAPAAAYAGKPYGGKPQPIPGTIQAEAYDTVPGGVSAGVTIDRGEPKQTPYRTTPDSVGLAGFGNGHVTIDGKPEASDQVYAGWTHQGQWWKYTVQVAEAGTYVFGTKCAAGNTGSKISVTFVPGDITTGPLEIPTTAGHQPGVEVYHVWETLGNMAEIKLPAGTFVMTVKIEAKAGLNFDYFTFVKKP